jgi:hypothetical protein
MGEFKLISGTKSAVSKLKKPIPDAMALDAIVQTFILKNPLGCTSYRSVRKSHRPIEKVRESYTAKFEYLDANGKRTGTGLDRYDSLDGYQYGIAAVLSNMANVAAHRGRVRHLPDADLFSVILKCNDPSGELFLISFARDRITLSSYKDDAIRKRVNEWTESVPALK